MMGEGRQEHVSERFARLLALYRRPHGSEWGGQDLERATGGAVTRSYASNLKKGRIKSPGPDKLEARAAAMGFSPQFWFGQETGDRTPDAAFKDETAREIIQEVLKLGPRDRRLLLSLAHRLGSSCGSDDG